MSSIRVLLVEDNFDARLAFEESVQQDRLPYDYAIASSVAQARKILNQEEFDIAIVNCDLRDGTALDLLPTLSNMQILVVLKAAYGKEEALIPLMEQNKNVRNYLIEDTDRRYLKLLPVVIQKVWEELQTQRDQNKQTENALQQYQQLLANLQAGIVVHAADTEILISNPRASELLGLTIDQMQGKTAIDPAWHFCREDGTIMPLAEYPVNQVIATEEPIENCIAGVNRGFNQPPIWLMVNAFPVFNAQEVLQQVVVSFIDITDLKQAQRDLQTLVEGAAAVTGENFFPALAEYIAAALDVRYVLISKFQGDCCQSYAFWADGHLQPNITSPMFNTPCDLTIAQGNYFCSDQVQQKFPSNEILATLGVDSYVGIALTNTQGEIIGTLCALDRKPLTQKQRAISMLRVFAARVSAELERQEANDALHQLNQDLETRVEQRTAQLQQAITERQQVEEQLRNLSDRLTLAIRSGSFGIWEYDIIRDTNIWDDRMYELYGLSPTNVCVTYTEWLNRLHPDDRAAVNDISEQVLQGKKEYNTEFRVIHPNGEIRFLKAYGIMQWNDQGEPQRLIGVNFDITDRKQAETALRLSEARYRQIVETAGEGIWVLDVRNITIFVNEKLAQMLGVPPEDILGRSWLDFISAEETQRVSQYLESRHNGIKEQQDFKFKRQNGSDLWAIVVTTPILNDQGQSIGILGMLTDISDRKRIEEALHQSEARNRAILEAIPDLLLRLKRDGSCLDCFLPKGKSAESFLPVSNHLSEILLPDLLARQLKAIEDAINTGELQVYEHQLSKRGQLLYNEVRVIAINDEEVLTIVRDITDRKLMEQALRYSEERFRIALKNSQIVVFNQDLDLRYTWMYNPGLGDQTEEVIGKLERDIFLSEDACKLEEIKRNVLATGKGSREEVTLGDRDNIKCYVLTVDPLYDRHGNLEGVTCAALDITQQKQIELVLQQQLKKEKLLVSVLQRIRDSLDFQEILNRAVDEVRQIIQADRVLVYQVFPDGTGKAVAESVIDPWAKVLNFYFPSEVFSQSSCQSYVQSNIYLINDRDRDLIPNSMMQFMQEFQIQAKLVVPIMQQENQQLWGWLIAHQCSQSRRWESWEITLLQQLAGQLAVAIDQSNLYCQLQVELNERKQAQADLYQANERLQIVNAELARATRLKDEFLANMSHELRTPLNAILGLSEGLLKEVFGSLNEKQKKYVSIIDRSGRHLLALINDILDLAKIEAGKVELEPTFISLNYLCESCLPFVKQQALKKRISLDADVPANLSIIEGDERRLKQVLINLLSNAVKFTPSGGKVRLEVQADPAMETFAIRVIDTGIGIAPEDMNKLFKSFSQVDSSLSRQHEGTGLGLALVQRIVSLHGGIITVESQVGQGSCFTVKLPFHQGIKPLISKLESSTELPSEINLLQTEARTMECRDEQKSSKERVTLTNAAGDRNQQLKNTISPSISSANKTEKPLVLLAEDNNSNVLMLSEYLKSMGYEVVVASNGIEAVEKAKLHHPAIILMDIQMPQMNGLEATRQIHANHATAEIPIFALTALAMPDDREKCLQAGVVEYLTKPLDLKQLISLIEIHIN